MEETQEKLGGKAAEAVIQSLQSPFHIWYIGIAISVVGFGLIVYKILEEKFARKITQPDIKKITEEVTIERRDLPISCWYSYGGYVHYDPCYDSPVSFCTRRFQELLP